MTLGLIDRELRFVREKRSILSEPLIAPPLPSERPSPPHRRRVSRPPFFALRGRVHEAVALTRTKKARGSTGVHGTGELI
jgi:hypothetical protein